MKSEKTSPHHGSHLADLRRAAGLTQVELAEALGLSQQRVAQWENSNRPPPSKLLPQLSELFRVSIEDLLSLTVKPAAKKRGPASRGQRLLEQVEQLAPRHQEKIYDVLKALVDQYSAGDA